jgi:hypothetical protein
MRAEGASHIPMDRLVRQFLDETTRDRYAQRGVPQHSYHHVVQCWWILQLLTRCITIPIKIEEIIENAFEQASSRALEQTVQSKAEMLFKKAFEDGSPLSMKLAEKIEQGFQRFVDEGIPWDKKKPGFRK